MTQRSKATISIRNSLAALLLLACAAFAYGCGEETASPDLKTYDNGYGTVFVTGTRIEHTADTSSSIVVDWRKASAVQVPEDLAEEERKGIVYEHGKITDGRDAGKPLELHLNLRLPKAGAAPDHKAGPEKTGAAAKEEGTDARASESKTPWPVVVLVPGGGFISCRIDDKYTQVQRYLVSRGYAVAIMEYHVIGQGRYQDAADDVQAAIRWIQQEGPDYGLDPGRIALVGNSGGGYVAALAACQDGENIRCVVNFYGLCDLANNKADYEDAAIREHHKATSSDSQFVNGVESGLGLTDAPEEAEKADPITYIDGDEPPFLHLHGDADLLVSPSQSVHLHQALQAAEVPSTRYSVVGAGHGDKAFRSQPAMETAADFLDQYCR